MSRAGPRRRGMAGAHAAPVSVPATILVVEDEVLIRMCIADDLTSGGYSVIEAASADEALSVLDAGLPIDILFSDIHMPGTLDGLGLTEVVRRRFPWVAIILTSGLEIPSPALLGDGNAFVPKPYASETVLALVGRAQARRRSGGDGRQARPAQAGGPAD